MDKVGYFSTLQACFQLIFNVLEFSLQLGSNLTLHGQGGAYKLYLVDMWNKHVFHIAAGFLSKKSTKGFYGDDMRLCKLYGRKYSPKKEFGHLREVKVV